MAIFNILIKGAGIRATFEGTEIPCGFFKNEVVWARNQEGAIDKARRNVEIALRLNSGVNKDLSGLRIEVEEVEGGVGVAHLFKRQGFVFHRLDGDGQAH